MVVQIEAEDLQAREAAVFHVVGYGRFESFCCSRALAQSCILVFHLKVSDVSREKTCGLAVQKLGMS